MTKIEDYIGKDVEEEDEGINLKGSKGEAKKALAEFYVKELAIIDKSGPKYVLKSLQTGSISGFSAQALKEALEKHVNG